MPCSPLKVSWRLRGTCHLHLQGQRISQARNHHEAGRWDLSACILLVSSLVYSSTLKMEATRSSETLVDLQQAIWHYVLGDITLHLYCLLAFLAINLTEYSIVSVLLLAMSAIDVSSWKDIMNINVTRQITLRAQFLCNFNLKLTVHKYKPEYTFNCPTYH
jgi:hypothetical protein